MLDKYQYLLLHESKRSSASSEEVMLARMWDTDERQILAKEKEDFKKGKVFELPPLPEIWAEKYEELTGKLPPPGIKLNPQEPRVIKSEMEDENLEDGIDVNKKKIEPLENMETIEVKSKSETAEENFLGLKFNRSQSGSWIAATNLEKMIGKEDDETYNEFESLKNEIICFADNKNHDISEPSTRMGNDDDDSDDDFCLKDIASAQAAVGSILHGSDSNEEDEDFDLNFGNSGSVPVMSDNDNDSVQNAINSILDLPSGERMETPDLNNIAGLLDSIEENDNGNGDQLERDPITEAAVNSIPRF